MKNTNNKETLKSILYTAIISIVVISSFLSVLARLPETSSYFTTSVSSVYSISGDVATVITD